MGDRPGGEGPGPLGAGPWSGELTAWEAVATPPSHSCPTLQAQILLDCGEDNICVPDLQLEVFG